MTADFIDIEEHARALLESVLDGVPVATLVPKDRPERFVRVWRNGGTAMNRAVDRPLITVEAWAPTSPAASSLARACRHALLDASRAMPIVRRVVEISGPYSSPDPESRTPRYRFSVQLTVRRPRATTHR